MGLNREGGRGSKKKARSQKMIEICYIDIKLYFCTYEATSIYNIHIDLRIIHIRAEMFFTSSVIY